MNKKYLISQQKKEELETELVHLKDVVLPEITRNVAEARAQGDLSENADYHASKDTQGKVDSRIKEIISILDNCEIYKIHNDSDKEDKISVGCIVEILKEGESKNRTYIIVGPIEADPDNNKISIETPLAKVIIGRKVSDEWVMVNAARPYRVQIKSIK